MTRKTTCINAVVLIAISLLSQTAPVIAQEPIQPSLTTPAAAVAPSRKTQVFFNQKTLARGNFTITGLNPENRIEFTVRKDEIVSQAQLNLQFTPSPSLIPIQSQLKVYLNEELMQVISLTADQLGKSNQVVIPIDPRYINDFNRLSLQFIGHYKAICENPANSTLWIDISKSSFLDLTLQTLPLKNNLSHFPEPFFDRLDERPITLPIVFSGQPGLMQQRAAAILASWFGTKARWRGQSFPALFNQLPERNAIVFVTNQQRPDFLKNYQTVNAPKIEMIDHPDNPYIKLLVISGRDDNDLIKAVRGIATGSILFRGKSVTIDRIETIAPRQPYDAPNWVRTDRPTTFVELQQFKEQLQTSGFNPSPVTLPFTLPPDLFLYGSQGINMSLNYRYTIPPAFGTSHLNISLNNYFVQSYPLLLMPDQESKFLGVWSLQNLIGTAKKFTIPVLNLGTNNQMVFEFAYVNVIGGGNTEGRCESFTLVNNYASIDGSSTIDFSNYYHYIAMPDLNAFANAGFPFSRLADLAQTSILISQHPLATEETTLLNAIGNIGSQTGYPALALNLTDDWSKIKNKDTDILIIGTIPPELYKDSKINLLLDKTKSWVNKPFRQNELPAFPIQAKNAAVNNQAVVSSDGIMSAIIGLQSPYYKHRSIIALLADTPRGFELLNETLSKKNLLGQVFGSVAVIRESGVSSLQVGSVYYVGHLPWYMHIWFVLKKHPIGLALATLLVAIILTFMLWRALTARSRRRLKKTDD
ncbi:cellulose biosynthesis cyclic di-GMP-binding regulatory protein BcsB [Legionella maioricensis]|uniref:Cyclic di-GMP-binding protein n=1 Tax=Legionella maioricensis TaxID=2896528 RepID=A0A9X2D2V5_9GAMM|nr:cellulose biosynthesis cyclic di-GMP-binding regulatory protein BcsB [Legionella maioricensis]MCL9685453.1 cellulose biosynthesis cyclic di-GMP-binding regulatory protein BcsB [Legionella maioricensis]MCL9689193.1 cellulose biosynthesis cyclic di-GMP-binding regulatory protein BcsB [Legionella maioricensis]